MRREVRVARGCARYSLSQHPTTLGNERPRSLKF